VSRASKENGKGEKDLADVHGRLYPPDQNAGQAPLLEVAILTGAREPRRLSPDDIDVPSGYGYHPLFYLASPLPVDG